MSDYIHVPGHESHDLIPPFSYYIIDIKKTQTHRIYQTPPKGGKNLIEIQHFIHPVSQLLRN